MRSDFYKRTKRKRCGDNLHLAIADNDNGYLGAISLKNIDVEPFIAEAITIRKMYALVLQLFPTMEIKQFS